MSSKNRNPPRKVLDHSFFTRLPHKLQDCVKSRLKMLRKNNGGGSLPGFFPTKEKVLSTSDFDVNLEKQLQAWKDNPVWMDQTPVIKVSVPKGSLCNLRVKVDIGLPPDAVYNIVTDPDNKRVFKNIKMKFEQLKTGFMKRFEGCWKVEPLFVDEHLCSPLKPSSWEDYKSLTGGKGRVGSRVSLDQLIQPALVPPPPISWYLRGITTRTTEMLIHDLVAEAARIRGDFDALRSADGEKGMSEENLDDTLDKTSAIKERWAVRRRSAKLGNRRLLAAK